MDATHDATANLPITKLNCTISSTEAHFRAVTKALPLQWTTRAVSKSSALPVP